MNESLKIEVVYHDKTMTPIQQVEGSDWIDLRTAEDIVMKSGDFKIISLGISVKLPEGYEAHIVPRSSTFKNFGVIQANHMGVIDESYCGNNDVWGFPAIAIRPTHIPKDTRICQFRIVEKQPIVKIETVDHLEGKDRGGFGSTGTR